MRGKTQQWKGENRFPEDGLAQGETNVLVARKKNVSGAHTVVLPLETRPEQLRLAPKAGAPQGILQFSVQCAATNASAKWG